MSIFFHIIIEKEKTINDNKGYRHIPGTTIIRITILTTIIIATKIATTMFTDKR